MEMPVAESWTFVQLLNYFAPKIFVALLCGGLIGLEREIKGKTAGIKTNMLICVGSAIYTALSLLISNAYANNGFFGDPARLAAQIVPGIGFLGAGAIIQSRGTIVGLTTAATIWVVAAIGICAGLGYLLISLVATGSVIIVLVLITSLEVVFLGRAQAFSCEIIVESATSEIRNGIQRALQINNMELEHIAVSSDRVQIRYTGHRNDQRRLLMGFWTMIGVKDVKDMHAETPSKE